MFAFRGDTSTGGVGVAFTDRWGGVSAGPFGELNLGRTDEDEPDRIVENFRRVREALDLRTLHVVHQVHGTAVHTVGASEAATWTPQSPLGNGWPGREALPVADAVVTDVPGAGVAVRVADCLPVLIAAPGRRRVAAVHAGRIGLLGGVIPAAVSALRDEVSDDLTAWIGPHICGDCYEVPSEMAAAARQVLPASAAVTSWGTPAIDLAAGAVAQLESLGVEVAHVGPCTRTENDHFSHRADPDSGRQVGVIWLNP